MKTLQARTDHLLRTSPVDRKQNPIMAGEVELTSVFLHPGNTGFCEGDAVALCSLAALRLTLEVYDSKARRLFSASCF